MLKLDDLKEISHTSPIWKRAGDKVLGGRKWPGVVLSVIVVTTVFLIIVAKRWVFPLCTRLSISTTPQKKAMEADFAEKTPVNEVIQDTSTIKSNIILGPLQYNADVEKLIDQ